MKMRLFVAIIALAGAVFGYPDYSPQSRCVSLANGHGRQGSGTPYTITPKSTTYKNGIKIGIEVTGTVQGIMMQARKVGDTAPQGTFDTPGSGFMTMRCSASADTISHNNERNKQAVAFNWNPPASGDVGEIQFVAIIHESENVYYENVKSASLTFSTDATDTGTTGGSGSTGNGSTGSNTPSTSSPNSGITTTKPIGSDAPTTSPYSLGLLTAVAASLLCYFLNTPKTTFL